MLKANDPVRFTKKGDLVALIKEGDLVRFTEESAAYFLIDPPDSLWVVWRENPDEKTFVLKNVIESDREIIVFSHDVMIDTSTYRAA
jgi:hypothetical protein